MSTFTTTFSGAIAICGLTHFEAADFLGVSRDTVELWAYGRATPPMTVWRMLAELYHRIQVAADYTSDRLDLSLLPASKMNSVLADPYSEGDPLPVGSDAVAGAMALLYAVAVSASTEPEDR